MKILQSKSRSAFESFRFIAAFLGLAIALVANRAGAATSYYFHIDGTGPTYGINPNDNLSWDGISWATAATGAPTVDYAGAVTASGAAGVFPRFNSTATPYTVTCNNSEDMAGMFGAAGVTLTIAASGGGGLNILPNTSLTAGLATQGFFTGGGTVTITAPITGTGGINAPTGGGTLNLFGNNTYSGGTSLSGTAILVFFNNDNSFGTGPINVNVTGFAPLLGTGGATITLPNRWTNFLAGGLNFAADPNTPVVLTGSVSLPNTLNLRNNGDSTSPLTLSGVVHGIGGLNLSANNDGTIVLSGANSYAGQTTLGGTGNSGVNVSVSSLNKVSGGNPSSSLGAPTSVANGTISIGGGARTSTLVYTGAGETSDRIINLAGTTGGATIQNDGSGALVLTSDFTATGSGAKALTLQGDNTGANTISGKIVNSAGGATALVKDGSGTWVLSAANTYNGGTTVNAGILEILGSISGSVTNNGGVLKLDGASALASTATIAASSGATVSLNFAGTQSVNALVIDGFAQASGTWGAPGSGAANTSSIFTGSGIINVLGKPVITEQPVSGGIFPGASFNFTVAVAGDLSTLTYQWKHDGNNIPGATDATYSIPSAQAADSGVYSCWVTNAFGWTNSADATLLVLGTNAYTEIVRSDFPISYWRLGETNGTIAYDAVGGNVGRYVNVNLNQPGYSLTDSDGGVGLPASFSGRGYVQVTNFSPFVFPPISPTFTFEGWAYFTNLTGVQRLCSTLNLSNPNGYAFGINGANGLRFTAGTVQDADVSLATPLAAGVWYHLVCTSDGNSYRFYVNGQFVGSKTLSGLHNGVGVPLQFGSNPNGYTNNASGDPLAEQIKGRIDEVAIYGYALSDVQITNHYSARYGTLAAPIVSTPVANPATNYESLSASIQAIAAGQALSYQWFHETTLLPDQTGETLTLSNLQLSDGGNYHVRVSNPVGTNDSPDVMLTVLAIPTTPQELNLTNGLVLHLPFDSDYADISGRNNNGTNIGATTLVASAAVGGKALHYSSDAGSSAFNYVTLGVRPDLKFGASTDFTVSYWVRQPFGSTYTNLPFFTDAVGSTGHGGFAFAPYQTATTAGGWSLTIGTVNSPSQFTSFPDSDLINDGNWHLLVHVAERTANVTTYLDGVQVDSQSISFIGSIDNANAATIGQDPTGAYPVTADADIDDLAVWRRALTPLEVSGIYLAGVSNSVSFAPPVEIITPATLNLQQVAGQWQITWTGTGGALQASGDVTGVYTNVPGATSPYTIPISSGPRLFYRLKY